MTRAMAIPPAVLLQHLGILGKTGRGKTTTAKGCVEQVYEQDARVCILDPIKSDWWGITSSADGKRAGLPFYILGGDHGHLPLSSSSGKAIADLVARGQLRHTVIDMANFEPGGQMRWFADFAPRLMQRMKGVLYLVMEEAHLFAPKERAGMGHENLSIHWAKMLATAGRTKGIRLIVLSQRTQAVHNALLGSLDSMIVHGMTAPADMDPVIKWLKANTKDKQLLERIEGSLSGLKTGTGWLCSSEAGIFELRTFPLSRTYDNTATPEDDSELASVKQAPVDLDALRGILGKAAADAEASDPALLRKRIVELEGLLAREKRNVPITPEEIDGHRQQGIDIGLQQGFREGFASCLGRAQDLGTGLQAAVSQVCAKHIQDLAALFADAPKAPAARVITPSVRRDGRILPVPLSMDAQKAIQERSRRDPGAPSIVALGNQVWPVQADPDNPDGVALNNVSHPYGGRGGRILAALRWCEARGMTSAPRAMVAALAGSSSIVGHTARVMGQLKTEGLVLYEPPGELTLTDAGRKVAPAPPSYAKPLEAWLAVSKSLQREILQMLANNHPAPWTISALAGAMGKSPVGHFARTVGQLRTMQAIHSPMKGYIALSRYVMP